MCNNFIFVSYFCENIFFRILPFLKASNTCVIPNKICFEGEKRISADLNKCFLFVGRMVSSKGPEQLLEALTILKLPGIFIGDGPLLPALKEKYPGFIFCGWLNSKKVRDFLFFARALVFPSLWYEAQPIVPQEALSLGIPVITANCNAATEFIENGYNGHHFDPDVKGDLIRVLGFFSGDQHVRRLSVNAFESFSQLKKKSHSRAEVFDSFYKKC